MNKTVWLTRILSIGGVLETGAGLGLLVAPSALSSLLLRSPVAGPGVVIARLAGGGLLSLGIACWCSRAAPSAPASLGVAWGFLAYKLIACVTLACAGYALTSDGLPALGAAALHGVLGVALLGALSGRGRSSAKP
jgi:hypothetical protein